MVFHLTYRDGFKLTYRDGFKLTPFFQKCSDKFFIVSEAGNAQLHFQRTTNKNNENKNMDI